MEDLTLTRDQLRVTDSEAAPFVIFETLDRLADTIVFSALPVSSERIKAETIDMIASYLLGVKEQCACSRFPVLHAQARTARHLPDGSLSQGHRSRIYTLSGFGPTRLS